MGKAPVDVLREVIEAVAAEHDAFMAEKEKRRQAKIVEIKAKLAEAMARLKLEQEIAARTEADGFVRLPQLELDGHDDEGPASLHAAARREAREVAAAAEDAALLEGGSGGLDGGVEPREGETVHVGVAGSEEEALCMLLTPEGER